MKKLLLTLLCMALASVSSASTGSYDYPISDPYAATIIGTPTEFKAPLPEKIRLKTLELTVFEDRVIPDVFWYQNKLKYSLAYQKKKSPLIFIIAGTGASYNSSKMEVLQKTFFDAGFHVLSLSSPTYSNFIVTASKSGVPGHLLEDSQDLYHVMKLAWEQVKEDIEVSEFFLTGSSLGGAQAAFVSKLDEGPRTFNFKKVLINTTIGVGGVMDVATSFDIQKQSEDFGQTLGFYGLNPGPYLVLPLFGPSTLRDTGGIVIDTSAYSVMTDAGLAELIDDDSDEALAKAGLTLMADGFDRHPASAEFPILRDGVTV